MPIFVQYTEDGQISAVVSGTKAPPHPRQVAFKDPPPPPKFTDVTVYTNEQAPDDLLGKRVELQDGKPSLTPCPRIAAQRANQPILQRLAALDAKSVRADRERVLTGKADALQAIEAEAVELRKQLVAVPE